MPDNRKRAYVRFVKNRIFSSNDNNKSNDNINEKPQETMEKIIEALKLQQSMLQTALEEQMSRSDGSSEEKSDNADFVEYHVEQLLMQISDKVTELEDTMLTDMDKIGENIYCNLSKSNENVEASCERIEAEMTDFSVKLEEKFVEQNTKLSVQTELLDRKIKEYIDEKLESTAKQDSLLKINSRIPILIILGIINVLGIVANIVLFYMRMH